MSSFLPLEDLAPTLSDVLAFLDDFDSSDSSQSSLTASSSSEKDLPATPSDASAKRKKSRAAASRRFQHKKKAELLALRTQVSALQKRLQELKQDGGNGSSRTVKGRLDETQTQKWVSMWVEKAQVELRLRLSAEAQNRQLKVALARQKQTAKVVNRLLQNVTSVVHIEEALRTPHPSAASGLNHFAPTLDDAIYSDLASRMSSLYLDADAVFSWQQKIETSFFPEKVEIYRDPESGVPYVELRLSTLVPLSVQDAGNVGKNAKAQTKGRYRKYYQTDDGLRKESEVELQNQSMALSVNLLSLSRTYEESNRVLNTWTSLVCNHPLDQSMRFRDQGWVMISPAPSNPLDESLVQVCYRLYPEMERGFHFLESNHEVTSMTIFLLQTLGSVTHEHLMEMGSIYIGEQLC